MTYEQKIVFRQRWQDSLQSSLCGLKKVAAFTALMAALSRQVQTGMFGTKTRLCEVTIVQCSLKATLRD
jgi:hypothetical protein